MNLNEETFQEFCAGMKDVHPGRLTPKSNIRARIVLHIAYRSPEGECVISGLARKVVFTTI